MDSTLNLEIKFNVAYIKLLTKTEGPFNRCCIWFQGCNLNCKGCCNKDLQPLIPKHIVSLEKLIEIIQEAKNKYDIEGVTLSGGEPSLQQGLTELCKRIRLIGLGIIMFTGKRKEDLDMDIINSVDLLIDGPFVNSQLDTERVLLGSKNKRLRFVTNRYRLKEKYLK